MILPALTLDLARDVHRLAQEAQFLGEMREWDRLDTLHARLCVAAFRYGLTVTSGA